MTQLPLAGSAHNNQQLFSDYFLDRLLPEKLEWQALAEEAALALTAIKAIYDAYTPTANEAQLENDVVRPVLLALGHTFEVQSALRTPDGTKKPDYVFYRDAGSQLANKGKTLTDALLQPGAIAVGDAKAWDRPLDITLRGASTDIFSNRNPSYQIAFYVQHSGLQWGVLTNGRAWRLYHKDTAHKLDRFYEVDVPALLAEGRIDRWLYFWAFFRRAAFDRHPLGLGEMLRASRDYAQGVGDSLKKQVYDALLQLAQGFLDHPANHLESDRATLKTIYDNSLIVLYRLLFVLYAEARELLPVRSNAVYRDSYSLASIKGRVAQDIDGGRQLLPTSSRYWNDLRELFAAIDKGNPGLGIAPFNGGLFDPQRHPFLEQYAVGDARLQKAIDLLARVDKQFVDYRDLAERHLGTIYEGLLEYHLEPLEQPNAAGYAVQLLNDKGERKATGSYYTPDYIVKYIVDNTVGPVLREAVVGAQDDAAKIRAVLDVNVLDPAMGSGHFLVEATEYIARFLVDLGVQPDEQTSGEADIAYWRRRVVQSCVYGVDLNPLAVELAKLSLWLITVAQDRPLSFLDHHLRTGNALIGARMADLQVGSAGAGAQRRKRKAKAESAGQLSLLDDSFRQSMSSAVDSMFLIETNPAFTVQDVKEQEQAFVQLRDVLTRRYGRLANLVTATYFGLQVDSTLWQPLADYVTGRRPIPLPRFEDWASTADRIAVERRFFHWELEFPEVFFDRRGYALGERAGFDVVISNPPYIDIKSLKTEVVDYIFAVFPGSQLRINVFASFFEQALQLSRSGASQVGLIIPTAFLTQVSYARIRQRLLSENWIRKIVRLPNELFGLSSGDVKVDTCLLIISNEITKLERQTDVLIYNSFARVLEISAKSANKSFHVIQNKWLVLDDTTIGLEDNDSLDSLVSSMRSKSFSLEQYCEFCLGLTPYDKYAGHTPAQIESKVFHSKYQLDPNYKRLIRSGDVARYEVVWNGEEWINYGPWLAAPREQRFFAQERILVQQIIDWGSLRIFAGWTDEELYNTQNQFNLLRRGEADLRFVLPILNSRLMSFYHRRVFLDVALQRFQKILIKDAKTFPIRRIAFTTPPEERERLAEKGRLLYEQFCRKHDYDCVLGFVEHQLPQLENNSPDTANERSDVVHDLLAFLAERMIAMHKQRRERIDDLVLDLEGVLDAKAIDKLGRLWTPLRPPASGDEAKHAVFEGEKLAATETLGALAGRRIELRENVGALDEEQWKWLLKRRLNKIENMAELVRVFRKRQPPIAEFDTRIAATDRLIDRIVYRLYGLNEDEIAIVEGREVALTSQPPLPAAGEGVG